MVCDALGNELREGDLLAYGTRSGNVGVLRFGLLTSLNRLQVRAIHRNFRTYNADNHTMERIPSEWTIGGYGKLSDYDKVIRIDLNSVPDENLKKTVQILRESR